MSSTDGKVSRDSIKLEAREGVGVVLLEDP